MRRPASAITADGLDARDLWPGQCVIYKHEARGGYGFISRIPAVVKQAYPLSGLALIEFDGRDGRKLQRRVRVYNLITGHAAPDGMRNQAVSERAKCGHCPHAPHRGMCTARNGQTAYPCPCFHSSGVSP